MKHLIGALLSGNPGHTNLFTLVNSPLSVTCVNRFTTISGLTAWKRFAFKFPPIFKYGKKIFCQLRFTLPFLKIILGYRRSSMEFNKEKYYVCSRSHVELSLRICKDLWAIFLEDLWRSCHCYVRTTADLQGSLQMFKDFLNRFLRKIVSGPSSETKHFILSFFNKNTKAQSDETLHHSKFLSRSFCPHHCNFGVWGMFCVGYTR